MASQVLVKILSKSFGRVRFMKKESILRYIIRFDDDLKHSTRDIMKKYYRIEVGKRSYGCFKVDGSIEPGTKIGNYCSVAPGVIIGNMNHPLGFVSTHPFLYDNKFGFVKNTDKKVIEDGTKKVIIEDDVWIGRNAMILPG